MRPKLLKAIEVRREHARVIHIRSPKELAEFVSNPVELAKLNDRNWHDLAARLSFG